MRVRKTKKNFLIKSRRKPFKKTRRKPLKKTRRKPLKKSQRKTLKKLQRKGGAKTAKTAKKEVNDRVKNTKDEIDNIVKNQCHDEVLNENLNPNNHTSIIDQHINHLNEIKERVKNQKKKDDIDNKIKKLEEMKNTKDPQAIMHDLQAAQTIMIQEQIEGVKQDALSAVNESVSEIPGIGPPIGEMMAIIEHAKMSYDRAQQKIRAYQNKMQSKMQSKLHLNNFHEGNIARMQESHARAMKNIETQRNNAQATINKKIKQNRLDKNRPKKYTDKIQKDLSAKKDKINDTCNKTIANLKQHHKKELKNLKEEHNTAIALAEVHDKAASLQDNATKLAALGAASAEKAEKATKAKKAEAFNAAAAAFKEAAAAHDEATKVAEELHNKTVELHKKTVEAGYKKLAEHHLEAAGAAKTAANLHLKAAKTAKNTELELRKKAEAAQAAVAQQQRFTRKQQPITPNPFTKTRSNKKRRQN